MAANTVATFGSNRLLPLAAHELSFYAQNRTLLHSLSLQIDAGDPTVILGPNGAGKTLLLKLCHGLEVPSSGAVYWNNLTPQATRRRQALLFQRPVLLRRSVVANIEYALRLVSAHDLSARAHKLLELAGLSAQAQRPARLLSGGQQQLLALARIWALAPEVILLDEPTANLDPAATRLIEQLIAEISNTGTKIILSTHDLAQAQRLARDVVFIHRGHLLERATANEFFNEPKSAEAAAFIRGELLWH